MQPARRGGHHIDPARQFLPLAAIADAAKDRQRAQVGETGKIAEGGLDLRGKLAGGFEDKDAGMRPWRQGPRAPGGAKAAVLPVPVWADPIKSRPPSTTGMARNWIGVRIRVTGRRDPRRIGSASWRALNAMMERGPD